MTPEQKKIYFDTYRAAVEALESTIAYRECRTASAKRRADAASAVAGQAASAASSAKSEVEYGEAYERLEEAACCAELVWMITTRRIHSRMNRKSMRAWANKIRALLTILERPESEIK